jgi:uncharacterized protein YegL
VTQPLSLILDVKPVQRGLLDRPVGTVPNVAVVYSTGAGTVAYFGGRPLSRKEQMFSPYRTRYDVDVSDHRRTVELRSTPLPSRGDYYFFIATVDVAFRVHDPAEVVRRNVRDALRVVYGFLANRFRVVTRNFDIEQSTQAEEAIRQAFAGDVQLPEGITIFEVSPRLLPDDAANRYLQQKAEAARSLETNQAQHSVNVQQALQQGELDRMQQMARLQSEQIEMTAMGNRELSVRGMVQMHLMRNPNDTEKAMSLLMQHEQAMLERQDNQNLHTTALFKFLVDNKVVQAADVESMLPSMLGQMGVGPMPSISAGAATWSQPSLLPGQAAPAPAESPGPAQKPPAVVLEQDPGTKVWKPADGVQPVYVVVDESAAVAPYIGDLSNGVHQLHEALLQAGDVAPAIRLSVLGFADELATRLPLEPVVAGSQSPWFTARGAASYANAFEMLLDKIDEEIPMLKQEQQKVLRPTVYLLSGSDPGSDGIWTSPYHRLTDRRTHRFAPNIVACGFGGAPADLIARIATEPDLGYVMAPDADVHDAIAQYWRSLAKYILSSGRALINGQPDVAYEPPAGFRLARELV